MEAMVSLYTAVLNERGEPVRTSNYVQILADVDSEKVYFLKEMYLLQGNENGTYGYVREVVKRDGIPCVYDVLRLEVDAGSDLEKHFGKAYDSEDDYLLDDDLDECLITQRYSRGEWEDEVQCGQGCFKKGENDS